MASQDCITLYKIFLNFKILAQLAGADFSVYTCIISFVFGFLPICLLCMCSWHSGPALFVLPAPLMMEYSLGISQPLAPGGADVFTIIYMTITLPQVARGHQSGTWTHLNRVETRRINHTLSWFHFPILRCFSDLCAADIFPNATTLINGKTCALAISVSIYCTPPT